MNEDVKQLVTAAISGTEQGQKKFAENIPAVLKTLDAASVRDQLVPFLRSWMPYNNKPAMLALSSHVGELARSAGGLKPVACIVQCLLATESLEVESQILSALEGFRGDAMLEELIQTLLPAPYDFVRAAVVKLLLLVGNDGFVQRTLQTLATDPAYLVKYAVAEAMKKVSATTAQEIVPVLAKDRHTRIRSLLAHDLYDQPYYFSFVPALVKDSDWCVRATVATALGQTKEIEKAAPLCEQLIEDGVWQVQTCALRSLTHILTENPSFDFELHVQLVSLLDDSRNPLKLAAIDCFFAQRKVDQTAVGQILARLGKEPGEVKLKFLEACKCRSYGGALADTVTTLVKELCQDPKWRIRLGVVSILDGLAQVIGNSDITKEFMSICETMVDDSAFPVRQAAIEHLAANYVREGDSIPAFLEALRKQDSYRKRQTAIGILATMRKLTTSDTLKQKIQTELESLVNDPINSVALVAKRALANE